MEGLSVNIAASEAKPQYADSVSTNKLPGEKRHTPNPVTNQDEQRPLSKRSCKGTQPAGTTMSLSTTPASPEDRAAALCFRLEKALQQFTGEDSHLQQKKNQASLKKILYDYDFHTLIMHTWKSGNMESQKKQLKLAADALNITLKEITAYNNALRNCLVYKVTDRLNLIAGLLFVLSKHPITKKTADYMEIIKKILEDSDTRSDDFDSIIAAASLLGSITSSDMVLMEGNSSFFEKTINDFLWTDSYFISLIKRATLFTKAFFSIQTIPITLVLSLNEAWWEQTVVHDNPDQELDNSLSGKTFLDTMRQKFSPAWLDAILFNPNDSGSNPMSFVPVEVLPYSLHHPFDQRRLLFGEEFEYIITTQTSDADDAELYIKKQMHKWGEEVKRRYTKAIIIEKGFDNNEAMDVDNDAEHSIKGLDGNDGSDDDSDEEDPTVTAILGDWEVQAKPENAYDNGRPVIEFTASPYAISQQFLLGEKQYSAYELLQEFVIEPAKNNGWIERSGHKHLDIADSIGNNVELLFRLLVAIENTAWLSTLIQRSRRSGEHYPYITQFNRSRERQESLQIAINEINKSVSMDKANAEGNPLIQISLLRTWWAMLTDTASGPGQIRYDMSSTTEDALKGKVSDPVSTIEFRFFHCSRNAEEVQLINQLLVAWLEYLSGQQQDKRPLTYEPVDPTVITHEEAIEKFKVFIAELGLDWETYKSLIRYPE